MLNVTVDEIQRDPLKYLRQVETGETLVILGQANFFFEFEVCFFRARSEFEVRPKQID